jgi:hypothetical protein
MIYNDDNDDNVIYDMFTCGRKNTSINSYIYNIYICLYIYGKYKICIQV